MVANCSLLEVQVGRQQVRPPDDARKVQRRGIHEVASRTGERGEWRLFVEHIADDQTYLEGLAAINDYLATLDQSQVAVKSLAELIAFNAAHANEELVVFGQEIFDMAEARGPLTDAVYQKAVATLQRAADTEGLAALLGQQGTEVLLAPSNGPAELIDHVWGDRRGGGRSQIAGAAAIAGYPSLTVPAGLVSGLPVGITLVGNRNQDGLLLQVARAYERAASPRMPPHLMV